MKKGDNKTIDYGDIFRTLLNISDGSFFAKMIDI